MDEERCHYSRPGYFKNKNKSSKTFKTKTRLSFNLDRVIKHVVFNRALSLLKVFQKQKNKAKRTKRKF